MVVYKSGDDEARFRSSTNGGQKFDNKINLSNTTNAESVDANITGSGNNVYVR
jgi:hypothetical protein